MGSQKEALVMGNPGQPFCRDFYFFDDELKYPHTLANIAKAMGFKREPRTAPAVAQFQIKEIAGALTAPEDGPRYQLAFGRVYEIQSGVEKVKLSEYFEGMSCFPEFPFHSRTC